MSKNLPPPVLEEPTVGLPLVDADFQALEGSWIDRETAVNAMLRRVDEYEAAEYLGRKRQRGLAGILIPYYWPGELHSFSYRIRRDVPDFEYGKDGKPRPRGKYLGPPGGGNR